MMPVLGALVAVGLWYAFVWGVRQDPLLMADLLVYAFAPAVLALAFGSLGWMIRTARADARAFAAKQAQWAAQDAPRRPKTDGGRAP